MTGPPTPPPSSATEIEDAARSSLPPPQAPPSDPVAEPQAAATPPAEPTPQKEPSQIAVETVQPPQKTSYELLLPTIAELARTGSLQELVEVAERADINADGDRDETRIYIVAPLVLSHMILDQLSLARHALTRLPEKLRSIQLMEGLFGLLAAVSERKYVLVYPRAEALHQSVQPPNFPSDVLGQVLAGMISAFVDAFRKRTFALIAKAYTSIQLQRAQVYLGLTAEQVVNVAVPSGWEFHETSYILTPPKLSKSAHSRVAFPVPTTLAALNLVADSVANLEA